MPPTETRRADRKGRITLPADFADATVLLERIGDSEIRVRKAVVVAADDLPFYEEALKPLSDRDRDAFLEAVENPPPPGPVLKRAAKWYKARHG